MLKIQGSPSNTAIVFIHGFLGNHLDWDPIINALSNEWYCITVDLPGHGDQGDELLTCSGDSALNKLFDEVLSVAKEPLNLVGYSLGGRVAMRLAQQHPDRILSLCIESAHPGLTDINDRKSRVQSDKVWANRFLNQPLNVVLKDWYQQAVFNCNDHKQLQVLIDKHLGQTGALLSKALSNFGLGLQEPYWDFLSQWRKPLLYISGESDIKFSSIGEEIKQNNQHSQHIKIKHSAHNCHQDQPQQFIEVIHKFLNDQQHILRRYQ